MDRLKDNRERVDILRREGTLLREEMKILLETLTEEDQQYLFQNAAETARENYGTDVYLRGLIEFSNYCKNDCYYCGIRRSNRKADRYRLGEDVILNCCDTGYRLGFRTFVLQSGEDPFFTDEKICGIVSKIKAAHPDCAVTLSIGEKPRQSYEAYFRAGADRYLLRHETINPLHYRMLHPAGQTTDFLLDDLYFMKEFGPHMIGIGPFIPHQDTPFRDQKQGSVQDTLRLLAVIRLMHPRVLLPATTALGTADPIGREKGILAGANVIMPNLSPTDVRGKYLLYDGKICTGDEAAECRRCMELRVQKIGYSIAVSRGDSRV